MVEGLREHLVGMWPEACPDLVLPRNRPMSVSHLSHSNWVFGLRTLVATLASGLGTNAASSLTGVHSVLAPFPRCLPGAHGRVQI